MKSILIALTLLSLPMAAPVLASQTPVLNLQQTQGTTIDRRAHHCNTAAQQSSARCAGI